MTFGPTFADLLREAWISIGSHRLRTFLAILGIVIGVGSVVLMMAVGAGSRRSVEAAIQSLGSNILMVLPGNRADRRLPGGRSPRLELKDATDLGQIPVVRAVAASSFPQAFAAAGATF